MITKHIHCIKMRAKRMNRPDMIERYKELAVSWGDDKCELTDYDHAQLVAMWDDPPVPKPRKKCSNCRGGL